MNPDRITLLQTDTGLLLRTVVPEGEGSRVVTHTFPDATLVRLDTEGFLYVESHAREPLALYPRDDVASVHRLDTVWFENGAAMGTGAS